MSVPFLVINHYVCYFLIRIMYSFCIYKNPVTAGLCSQYYKETMH
jgi:hypothetical protein